MKDFIDDYLKRGFGSMNKNDFEVFIMHKLLEDRLKGKSNYEISRELKIPETKVKRLIYEVSLKYDSDEVAQKERLLAVLKNVHIYGNGKVVMFVVENTATRNYLNSLLKAQGLMLNYKLNSEIVELERADFIALLSTLFTPEEQQRISDHAFYTIDGNNGSINKNFKDHMNDILDKMIEKGKDKMADLTVEGIIKIVAKIAMLTLV